MKFDSRRFTTYILDPATEERGSLQHTQKGFASSLGMNVLMNILITFFYVKLRFFSRDGYSDLCRDFRWLALSSKHIHLAIGYPTVDFVASYSPNDGVPHEDSV